MDLIVAVDRNWAIGHQNKLLVSIPADKKFFRDTTTGKVVVMGRKTLESFPNGLPLKNRTNLVLTGNRAYQAQDAILVHDLGELFATLRRFSDEDVYVIGGERVYRQLLPYCRLAHVTKIDHAYQADTYFPNLDQLPTWRVAADSEEQTYFDLVYRFYLYENCSPKPIG